MGLRTALWCVTRLYVCHDTCTRRAMNQYAEHLQEVQLKCRTLAGFTWLQLTYAIVFDCFTEHGHVTRPVLQKSLAGRTDSFGASFANVRQYLQRQPCSSKSYAGLHCYDCNTGVDSWCMCSTCHGFPYPSNSKKNQVMIIQHDCHFEHNKNTIFGCYRTLKDNVVNTQGLDS